nr:alpha/beta hydrolase [Litorivivens lipolytica]
MAVLAACASHTGVATDAESVSLPKTEYQIHRGLTYTPDNWPQALKADIYQPSGTEPFPAVLVVHGGGWERRSPDDMESISKRLASHGFVAVNIAYRFAPHYQFPAQLHDLQQAMHWIKRNADRYGIDPEQVSALGYSAGAHLVSLLGVVAGTGSELDQPYGGRETKPVAVVAGGTPSDLRKFTGGTLVLQFLGGTIDQVPETFAAASPVVHVHKDAPPFFLYHGSSDLLVSDDHATDFRAELDEAGVYTELYLLKWRGHLTAFATSGSAIEEAMRFLRRNKD